jgi:hypothetical protein
MDTPGRLYFKDEVVYTDWFGRGGDGMIVRFEIIGRSTNATIDVAVYTKNSEDTGTGSAVSGWTLTGLNSTGLKEFIKISDPTGGSGNGLDQMVRLQVSASGTAGGDWSLVRLFPPIFFDRAA